MARNSQSNDQAAGPTLAPIAFATGIAVLLAGLVVSSEVILPVGGAITLLAAGACPSRYHRGR